MKKRILSKLLVILRKNYKMKNHIPGTRTFYFPLDRDNKTPPQATVLIRRVGNEYIAAYSVASVKDSFEKRKGKMIALSRLKNEFGYKSVSILPITSWLIGSFSRINSNHPGTLSETVFDDLKKLPSIFEKNGKDNSRNSS